MRIGAVKNAVLTLRDEYGGVAVEGRKWRQTGLVHAYRCGPSNKVLQATPTALRSFRHNCPLVNVWVVMQRAYFRSGALGAA